MSMTNGLRKPFITCKTLSDLRKVKNVEKLVQAFKVLTNEQQPNQRCHFGRSLRLAPSPAPEFSPASGGMETFAPAPFFVLVSTEGCPGMGVGM